MTNLTTKTPITAQALQSLDGTQLLTPNNHGFNATANPRYSRPRATPLFPGYAVKREIGYGGNATVFLAHPEASPNQSVAIKLMAPRHQDQFQAVVRFTEEIRLLKGLKSPHVVEVYEYGRIPDGIYLVMAYHPSSLKDIMNQGVSPEAAIQYVTSICDALSFIHTRGVWHRDLKPSNILLDDQGRAILIDFGASLDLQMDMGLTNTGEALGTPYYVSPEQIADKPIDGRTDLYSLGIILFEMLAGYRPFEGRRGETLIHSHLYEAPPRLPRDLALLRPIVERLLAKDPTQRFPSAGALRETLAMLAHSLESKGAQVWDWLAGAPGMSNLTRLGNLGVAAVERLQNEIELRRALHRGELKLHYQPQWQLEPASGARRLIGAEALLRWEHPKRGILGPGELMPIAEESGLICPIGRQVLRQTVLQISQWVNKGLAAVPLSVNLCRLELAERGLVDYLADLLEQEAVDPSLIELEVSEAALGDSHENTRSALRAFKGLGCRLALDNYGTGATSLLSVRSVDFDRLKLDRTVIRGAGVDQRSTDLVKAIIGIGRSLGLPVMAEGVESEEQSQLLTVLGCHEAQGYLYGHPVRSDEMTQLVVEANNLKQA